jgi:hypothetical protein
LLLLYSVCLRRLRLGGPSSLRFGSNAVLDSVGGLSSLLLRGAFDLRRNDCRVNRCSFNCGMGSWCPFCRRGILVSERRKVLSSDTTVPGSELARMLLERQQEMLTCLPRSRRFCHCRRHNPLHALRRRERWTRHSARSHVPSFQPRQSSRDIAGDSC